MRIDPLLQAAQAAKNAAPELAKLRRATQQVEAMFFRDLLAAARKGDPDSLQGSFGSTMYRDLFDQSLSETLAERGALGVSGMIYRQLGKAVLSQEVTKLKLNGSAQAERKEPTR